jgi:hypothetical protein
LTAKVFTPHFVGGNTAEVVVGPGVPGIVGFEMGVSYVVDVGIGDVVVCEQSCGQFQSVSVPPQTPSPQIQGYPQSTEQELLLSVGWQILSPQVSHLRLVGWAQSFSQLVGVSSVLHFPSPQ